MKIEVHIKQLLAKADIEVNGSKRWDIKVHDNRFYRRVFFHGSLGFGEAYMNGWWDSDAIDETIYRILKTKVERNVHVNVATIWRFFQTLFVNEQSKIRALQVADEHYDLSVDLYMSFLDPYNQYTCGYFKDTDDLPVAQEQKMDLICKKMRLTKDDTVLDIGCGWGGFAKYAAKKYRCKITGLTISKEQAIYAREFTKGLPVEIIEADYREFVTCKHTYSKIVSVGMFEHVGHKNYKKFHEVVSALLKENGLFLLHTIGSKKTVEHGDPWLNKYIFPHGMLPSIPQISKSVEGLFVVEDWHNFGAYYDTTLMLWFKNFDTHW